MAEPESKQTHLSTPSKEEIEALVQTKIYSENNHDERHQSSRLEKAAENDVKAKAPNLIERAKEEIEAIIHHGKSPVHHHIETHGRNDDIDDSTPIDQVKGPSVFQRAKEEVEALVQTIHRKKESSNSVSSPKKEGGFGACIGKGLEKICSFNWGSKRD
ncbi:hypothetical protein POPTR_006G148000v4 [Populus trichocarpa]|uniref:Uncharacterized protein n=1 Tax=Populus trichocarpa TaxID=3694 RepID=A0A3N7GEN5_POPTR|nr:uncharacterized protein LOC7484661 isoform X1 [Populus trichocarpa]KAI5585246.1 hypothetical protein BDE02_06G132600 [Populus trichocarpa]RQO91748.1 hypothetical protein POPTR_006G148000v4 [Populus trichocarpa]|eukprot:XP_024459006.1 uncharacterized protein LOC7484661 isoform X1 [Populus trichocarpa]